MIWRFYIYVLQYWFIVEKMGFVIRIIVFNNDETQIILSYVLYLLISSCKLFERCFINNLHGLARFLKWRFQNHTWNCSRRSVQTLSVKKHRKMFQLFLSIFSEPPWPKSHPFEDTPKPLSMTLTMNHEPWTLNHEHQPRLKLMCPDGIFIWEKYFSCLVGNLIRQYVNQPGILNIVCAYDE